MHVGIICACLPAHSTLLKSIWPRLLTPTQQKSLKHSSMTSGADNKSMSKNRFSQQPHLGEDCRSEFMLLEDVESCRGKSVSTVRTSTITRVDEVN